MAIAVVHDAQSTGAATGNIVFGVTATAGSLLVCMIQQTNVAAPPTVKDNLGASWTVEAETAEASATSSVYCAWKKAAGGETELTASPGSTSTVVGVGYLEASGANTTAPFDVLKGTTKQAASETHESGLISPTTANCLIYACAGFGASSQETVEWTASTSGVMTTFTTAKARTSNGYILLSGTTAQHYTVKIKTSIAGAVLVAAIKPAATGEHAERAVADTITVSESVTRAVANPRAIGDTVTVSESVERAAAHPRAVADAVSVSESLERGASLHPRATGDTVSVTEGVTRAAAHPRTLGDSVSVAEGITGAAGKQRFLGDTVTVTESATRSTITFSRNPADNVTVSEALARTLTLVRAVSDTIVVTESVVGVFVPASNLLPLIPLAGRVARTDGEAVAVGGRGRISKSAAGEVDLI